jgi:hypothetical protein
MKAAAVFSDQTYICVCSSVQIITEATNKTRGLVVKAGLYTLF